MAEIPVRSEAARGKKRRSFPRPLPAPEYSACLYVRIAPPHIAMFRFLLEAEDNLAYMSTVDRWASVLRVTFSPHQREAVNRYLASMRSLIPFTCIFEPKAD